MKYALFICISFLLSCSAVAASDILVVGDSNNVGPYGDALYRRLTQERGLRVRSVGLTGASGFTYSSSQVRQRTSQAGYVERSAAGTTRIPDYNRRPVVRQPVTVPRLSTLIAQDRPRMVVVGLGDNFANYQSTVGTGQAAVRQHMDMIFNQFPTANPIPSCVWVTPIWTDVGVRSGARNSYGKSNPQVRLVNGWMKSYVEERNRAGRSPRCTVIDSAMELGISAEQVRTTDGLHVTTETGQRWGAQVGSRIANIYNTNRTNPATAASPGASPQQNAGDAREKIPQRPNEPKTAR